MSRMCFYLRMRHAADSVSYTHLKRKLRCVTRCTLLKEKLLLVSQIVLKLEYE